MKFNYSDNSRYKIGESLFYPQITDAVFEVEYTADIYASEEQVVFFVKNSIKHPKYIIEFKEPFKLNIRAKVHGMVEFYIETPNWTVNPIGSILTVKEIKQSEI